MEYFASTALFHPFVPSEEKFSGRRKKETEEEGLFVLLKFASFAMCNFFLFFFFSSVLSEEERDEIFEKDISNCRQFASSKIR